MAGLGAASSCAIGVLTGIGGGIVRDVLVREIPIVLRREIYAVASLAGALIVCLGDGIDRLRPGWLIGAAVVVFVIRVLAIRRSWSAPRPRPAGDHTTA